MWEKFKYHIVLHLIIFIWGFTAILGVFIDADAFVLVWYRVVIAFISLFVFLVLFRKKWRIRDNKQLLKVLGVGVIVALHWLTFYLSIKTSTASMAIICLSTTTLHVAWLEPLVMRRKFLRSEFILGVIIIVGVILITNQGTAEQNTLGLIYGLVAALFAGLFATFNAKLIHEIPASKITLYEMLSASLTMTVVLIFMGELDWAHLSISTKDVWLLLFLGVVCTSIAFLVTVEITKFLGAFTVTLSINMEPIYTLGLAAWLLSEHKELNLIFYAGAVLIVAAVFMNAVIKRYQSKQLKKASQLKA